MAIGVIGTLDGEARGSVPGDQRRTQGAGSVGCGPVLLLPIVILAITIPAEELAQADLTKPAGYETRVVRTIRPRIWRGYAGIDPSDGLSPRITPNEENQRLLAVGGFGVQSSGRGG